MDNTNQVILMTTAERISFMKAVVASNTNGTKGDN